MSSSIAKLPGWTAAIIMLACMAAPAQQAEEQEFLVIRSQGYSRYEITGNDVIAYITGGVDCTYLGFSIHADSVSYNQATKVAEAAGNIILGIPLKPEKTPGDAARATDGAPPGAEQITISCHSLMLSGTEGRLNIYGPLGGTIPRLAAGLSVRSHMESESNDPRDCRQSIVVRVSLSGQTQRWPRGERLHPATPR